MVRRFRTNGLRRAGDNGAKGERRLDEAAGWRRLPAHESPWAALEREIDRSRRHGRALALLRLTWHAEGRRLGAVVDAVRATVRSVDSVWVDHEAIFVLLPESDRAAADRLLARLGFASPGIVDTRDARVASFPQDGLTANALRAAVSRARPSPPALQVGPARAAAGDANGELPATRGDRPGLRRDRRNRP